MNRFANRELSMLVALVAIWAFFAWQEPVFLSARNLSLLSVELAVTAVLALGMLVVLLPGQIDLSAGTGVGLAGAVAAVLVFWHDVRVSGDRRAIALGGALVFGSAFAYALYLVGAGNVIARLGSMRFIAWAMLASTVFVLAQFLLTRPLSALAVPPRIHLISLAMAVFSTVLPTWLVAEAFRRGTAAWDFKDKVEEREIKKRAEALRTLGQKKRETFYRACVWGKRFGCLHKAWTGQGRGWSRA